MSKAKANTIRKSTYKPPVLKHLGALRGKWKVKGQIKNDPDTQVKGWESYEWMKGGFFMMMQWKITVRKRKTKDTNRGIMVIGHDKKAKGCNGRSYDDNGSIEDYKVIVQKGTISINGASKRFEGKFSKDRSNIEGVWQQKAANGKWVDWYDKRMKKVKRKK